MYAQMDPTTGNELQTTFQENEKTLKVAALIASFKEGEEQNSQKDFRTLYDIFFLQNCDKAELDVDINPRFPRNLSTMKQHSPKIYNEYIHPRNKTPAIPDKRRPAMEFQKGKPTRKHFPNYGMEKQNASPYFNQRQNKDSSILINGGQLIVTKRLKKMLNGGNLIANIVVINLVYF